jgi:hypothetical protein
MVRHREETIGPAVFFGNVVLDLFNQRIVIPPGIDAYSEVPDYRKGQATPCRVAFANENHLVFLEQRSYVSNKV